MKTSEIRKKINELRNTLRKRKRQKQLPSNSSSDNESESSESTPPPKRRRQIISSDDDLSDQDHIADNTTSVNKDEDIISILGEDPTFNQEFGDDMHSHIAVRWNNILQKGLKKDIRSDLMKKYLPPANCTYIQPPKLNDEIRAAVQENAIKRDAKLEQKQMQLGTGITCLGKAIDVALKIQDKSLKDQILKILCDGGQTLTDLHYLETLTRRSLLIQGFNKNTKDAIKNLSRDKLLFGEALPEKLKALKACSKSATDMKVKSSRSLSSRTKTDQKSNGSHSSSAALNWRGSSRRYTNSLTAGAYRDRRPAAASSTSRRQQTSQRPQPAKRS